MNRRGAEDAKEKPMEKVNLAEKFGLFDDYWSPRIAGELNESYVKLVKVKGEFVVVPRGVEHRPVAPEETHIVLLEPKTTLNTGNVENERTVAELKWV